MKSKMYMKSGSIAALLAGGLVLPAVAQAVQDESASMSANVEQDDDVARMSSVVVTANRREQDLSRVGSTVTVVGGDDLVSLGVSDPGDLVTLVPGFQATKSYGGSPNYTLRGVGFNTRNTSATAPIGIYLDEVAVPYPYMSTGLLFDLERVEVLKGPQGTLYGRNATGGLVNFVAAKPTEEFKAGATVEAGNFSTLNAGAYISGPLSDGVRFRFAYDTQNRFDGWQESVTRNETLGELEQNSFRLSLDFDNGGPLSGFVTGNYWNKVADTQAPQAIFHTRESSPFTTDEALASVIANPSSNEQADWLPFSRQPQADIGIIHPRPLTDSEFTSLTGRISYDLNDDMSLVLLTNYALLDASDVSDAAGLQTESIYQESRNRIDTFSQELRLVGETDRLSWSVGGYYAEDDAHAIDFGYADENAVILGLRALAASLPSPYTPDQVATSFGNYRNDVSIDTEVLAGFGNVEYQYSDLLRFTVGGRLSRDEIAFNGCTYDTNGLNLPVINSVYPLFTGQPVSIGVNECYILDETGTDFVDGTVSNEQSETNFAWKTGVDITPSENTLYYFTISQGFKSGGFPVLAGSNVRQFEPIRQEKLTAFEVGGKFTLPERDIQLNLSAFYYDYKDKQLFGRIGDLIFGTLSRIDNVPESNAYGIEGDFVWQITDHLTASAGGLYMKTEIEEYSGFDELGVPTDFAGRSFAYTPEFQGNATLRYTAPISGDLDLNGLLTVAHQSKASGDLAGSSLFEIDANTLVDGSLGIAAADDRWRIDLYVENLFDEYYWTGLSSATETVYRYSGMPRQYGVRASVKY